jgi:hypothetical protein
LDSRPAVSLAGDCLASLAAEGAVFNSGGSEPSSDARCAIAQPVTLEALAPRTEHLIDLPDHPTLDCVAALTFGRYVRQLLVPLAKGAFDATIVAIGTGPGFDCRTRDNVDGAKLSAHAKGLAVDIADIIFAGGRIYQVGNLPDGAERDFDTAARAAACGYFHTALGPGADAFHTRHWHFDLEPRGSDGQSKFCQ